MMLRECVRLAREEQRRRGVPRTDRALSDARSAWRQGWRLDAPLSRAGSERIALGEVGVQGDGHRSGDRHLWQRPLPVATGASRSLPTAGIKARIIDLRWLSPLPEEALLAAVEGCKRILIVDECRRTGGVAEALMALFAEAHADAPLPALTAEDSFIATGPAYAATMPSADSIVAAAMALVEAR